MSSHDPRPTTGPVERTWPVNEANSLAETTKPCIQFDQPFSESLLFISR